MTATTLHFPGQSHSSAGRDDARRPRHLLCESARDACACSAQQPCPNSHRTHRPLRTWRRPVLLPEVVWVPPSPIHRQVRALPVHLVVPLRLVLEPALPRGVVPCAGSGGAAWVAAAQLGGAGHEVASRAGQLRQAAGRNCCQHPMHDSQMSGDQHSPVRLPQYTCARHGNDGRSAANLMGRVLCTQ